MRIETALNHERRFLGFLDDIWNSARISAQSHAWVLEQKQTRIYSDPVWARVPKWVQSRVLQRGGDLLDTAYRPELCGDDIERIANGRLKPEFVPWVRWQLTVDGEPVTSNDICKRRADGDENIWKRVVGQHVWNHKPKRGFSEPKGWDN